MREGRLIETRGSSQWSKSSLVKAMLGEITDIESNPRDCTAAPVSLRVTDLSLGKKLHKITFDLHDGEVLGIAGLVGSGRSELLRSLAGAERSASGLIEIDGHPHSLPMSIGEALRNGIVMAPEDRKRQGLVLSRSARSNITLGNVRRASGWLLKSRRTADFTGNLAAAVGFDKRRLQTMTKTFSGGNQQKLILARCMGRQPRILLLDEPTRGIDLGAKSEIFKSIKKLSGEGVSVILVSSDLEEVAEHSDRVLVMAAGRMIGTLHGDEITVANMLNLIFLNEAKQTGNEVV